MRPRLVGSSAEWNGDELEAKERYIQQSPKIRKWRHRVRADAGA
ncbi:MAG: hypothetical protein OXI73_10150 [Rhodospirillales bacterium]|nr:hypothetical protein [Rhodospirillales bacterium]MDE0372891.1 hypothetical protein [Rhodospirillales bacterium]